jgi:hypothetical protein
VRTTTVTCDRCRRVIEADAGMIVGLGVLKDTLGPVDLCDGCARELLDWLRIARENDFARPTPLDDQVSASI